MNDSNSDKKRRTLSVVGSIAIVVLLVSLVYYGVEKSSPHSVPVPTSGRTGLSASENVLKSEEAAGLLNCTEQEEAFINEGAIYSQMGYPVLQGDDDNPVNPQSPVDFYVVQFPNQPENVQFSNEPNNVLIGTVDVPVISVCQALAEAISSLGIDSSNYKLAEVAVTDGGLNLGYPASASWTFYFAHVYQGYWLEGIPDNLFSASASVDAVNGSVYDLSLDNLTLPSARQNWTLSVNSTQALQLVRHTKVDGVPASVANGTLVSNDLRVAAIGGAPYPTFQPINGSTTAGQLRLMWIVSTSTPDYLGVFGVDAETGQVVVAESDPTLPLCTGPHPICGEVYYPPYGVYSTPIYGQTKGLQVASESFEIDGSPLGLNGTYSVEVPHVIVMPPGSHGSIGLNLTGIETNCPSSTPARTVVNCRSNSNYLVTPSTSSLPSGVSVSFSKPSITVEMGGSANDTMLLSVAPNATQGTYIVFLNDPPDPDYPGYVILSIWNGQGQWPVLPMLSVPLSDGQNQPIIFNGTSG